MISCEQASFSVNLCYSALKFVNFKGFVWSGAFLPLQLHSLGELFGVEVALRTADGRKQPGAYWERGLLHAEFQPGRTYDLDMRLEYCVPIHTDTFHADFAGIHPKSYLCALDFSRGNLADGRGVVRLQLGEAVYRFPVGDAFEQTLPEGHRVALHCRDDLYGFHVSHRADAPYGHRHFPVLSLEKAPAQA